MDEFSFCLEIIKREVNKFNLSTMDANTTSCINAATFENINYDNALHRCSYMYRCGTINLCFLRDCFAKFFSDFKSIVFLLSKWISHPNLSVCSLNTGPALDYIAFLLSYQHCGKFPTLFKDIKVISKHGAWRNTVNIMHQIVTEGNLRNLPIPALGKIEVIQGDPFKDFTQKVKDPICNADILIMMKKINLQETSCNQDIINAFQELIAAMKTDAILFCIDTKPSITVMTNVISSFNGTYLLKPTFINTQINLELTDFYTSIFGCYPVISARGSFFVWQKSLSFLTSSNLMDEVSESVKRLIKMNGNDICSNNSSENNFSQKFEVAHSLSSTSVLPLSSPFEKSNEHFISNENFKYLDKESENKDLLFSDSVNIVAQSSKKISPSSLQNDSITFGDLDSVLITEITSNSNSVNKSTQTEPILSSESIKITALTERMTNLIATIHNLLETNERKNACNEDSDCENHDCLKQTEQMDKGSAYCDRASTSSQLVSCQNKCHFRCQENLCNSSQEKSCGSYSSYCIHKQVCLPCNQFNCSTSSESNCETINNTPYHELKISSEKKSKPKLVIPLTNLPGDVIAQIVSLISKSNMEPDKL